LFVIVKPDRAGRYLFTDYAWRGSSKSIDASSPIRFALGIGSLAGRAAPLRGCLSPLCITCDRCRAPGTTYGMDQEQKGETVSRKGAEIFTRTRLARFRCRSGRRPAAGTRRRALWSRGAKEDLSAGRGRARPFGRALLRRRRTKNLGPKHWGPSLQGRVDRSGTWNG